MGKYKNKFALPEDNYDIVVVHEKRLTGFIAPYKT